jgi:hypothetical protein
MLIGTIAGCGSFILTLFFPLDCEISTRPYPDVATERFSISALDQFRIDCLMAFMTSGLACLLGSLLVLRVTRPAPAVVPVV